jgi:hypothetical protein
MRGGRPKRLPDLDAHAVQSGWNQEAACMQIIGRVALLAWALVFLYIGYLLVMGQSNVAFTALDAGRMSEAIMQFVFITLVFIGTAIAALLFIFVGVLRE